VFGFLLKITSEGKKKFESLVSRRRISLEIRNVSPFIPFFYVLVLNEKSAGTGARHR